MREIRQITAPLVVAYIDERKASGLSPRTIATDVTALRRLGWYAEMDKWVPHNFVPKDLSMPHGSSPRPLSVTAVTAQGARAGQAAANLIKAVLAIAQLRGALSLDVREALGMAEAGTSGGGAVSHLVGYLAHHDLAHVEVQPIVGHQKITLFRLTDPVTLLPLGVLYCARLQNRPALQPAAVDYNIRHAINKSTFTQTA